MIFEKLLFLQSPSSMMPKIITDLVGLTAIDEPWII
jgi:hypothetical protein